MIRIFTSRPKIRNLILLVTDESEGADERYRADSFNRETDAPIDGHTTKEVTKNADQYSLNSFPTNCLVR
jgi:hypothetical protein